MDSDQPKSIVFGPQLDLDGKEIFEQPVYNPERSRCSVASMLNADKLGLKLDEFMFIQPEMIEAVRPSEMRKSLILFSKPKKEDLRYFVSYDDERHRRTVYVAVTTKEAKVLPRNVEALAGSAWRNTQSKTVGPTVSNNDQSRAERAGIHVQESKLPKVNTYLESLESQAELLKKFEQASRGRNVGLSMFGKEKTFRENFVYLQTFIIDDIVRAYGERNRLPETSMEFMSKTLTYAISLSPNKFHNFNTFMKFALEYNGHKQELARERKNEMIRNIGTHALQTDQE